MRYTLPQFIEHEAKVIGPLTIKQFIFVAIAAAVCFILLFSLPIQIALIAVVIIVGSTIPLVFIKIEDKPLSSRVWKLLTYNFSSKMYVWKKKGAPEGKFFEKELLIGDKKKQAKKSFL